MSIFSFVCFRAYRLPGSAPICLIQRSRFSCAPCLASPLFLPAVIAWTLARLGYDRRAWLCQTLVALVVLPMSFWLSNPGENVNWVYGFGEKPQTILPAPF